MFTNKSLQDVITWLNKEQSIKANIVHWETIPEKEATYTDFPESLHPKLRQALIKKGINSLYSHQKQAYEFAMASKSFIAVTPTASGKTLCYNLPVLQTILENEHARALYLFPTKALSNDQKSELVELINRLEVNINTYTYDGDTPAQNKTKDKKSRPYRDDKP